MDKYLLNFLINKNRHKIAVLTERKIGRLDDFRAYSEETQFEFHADHIGKILR